MKGKREGRERGRCKGKIGEQKGRRGRKGRDWVEDSLICFPRTYDTDNKTKIVANFNVCESSCRRVVVQRIVHSTNHPGTSVA